MLRSRTDSLKVHRYVTVKWAHNGIFVAGLSQNKDCGNLKVFPQNRKNFFLPFFSSLSLSLSHSLEQAIAFWNAAAGTKKAFCLLKEIIFLNLLFFPIIMKMKRLFALVVSTLLFALKLTLTKTDFLKYNSSISWEPSVIWQKAYGFTNPASFLFFYVGLDCCGW